MSLINRRSLRGAGATLHLPPFNAPQPGVSFQRETKVENAPFGNAVIVYNKAVGRTIDIKFMIAEDNVAAALAAQDAIEAKLMEADGTAKAVDYCEWYDSGATAKRIYRACQVIDGPKWGEARSEKHRECSFTLLCPDPVRYTTFSDASTPGSGPYETYLFNGSSGTIPVPIKNVETITGTLMGVMVAPVTALTQLAFTVIAGGTNVIVKGLRIVGCTVAGGSESKVRISDTNYTGAGNYIEAAVALDEVSGARAAGSFTVADGATIYLKAQTAGGHANLQCEIDFESA